MSTTPAPEQGKTHEPRDSEIFICALIASFPCLKDRTPYTPATWDADHLGAQLGVLSTGERHAALFILNVWNPGYAEDRGWKFDVMDALGSWGTENRQAFLDWAANPKWP